MSDSQQHGPTGRIEGSEEQGGELTRRTVLVGVAATTVAATVAGIDTPAAARSIDPEQPRDMVLFVLLSAALTGIAEQKLSTGFRHRTKPAAEFAGLLKQLEPGDLPDLIPGNDPVDIKRDYFRFVQARYAPGLEYLLSITEGGLGTPDREKAITDRLTFADDDKTRMSIEVDAKYLARSIALMWYLGAWYEPNDLLKVQKSPDFTPNFTVISPKAYTQAWALRVAQAHPMGFSQMQFGYWNVEPNQRSDFTGS